MDQDRTDKIRPRTIVVGFVAAYLAWLAFVLASGTGLHLFGWTWDFETVGQLGDAFGGLSAFMASLAAMFTLQALNDERLEARRLRAREEERDAVEVERDRTQQQRISEERRRDLELTYFRMLELRRDILSDVQIGPAAGVSAFRNLESVYSQLAHSAQFYGQYQSHYQNFDHVLGHYFRFTYHIVRYLDESFDFERAYFYVRILRAQLSSGEQFMIALNAIYGEGKDKMLPLINKYSLLHTMPEEDKARLIALGVDLQHSAFNSPGS